MSESMTDTSAAVASTPANDAVSAAFTSLSNALKLAAFEGDSATFDRCSEYFRAVGPLAENWAAGMPASGKVKGRPGRRPKNAGAASEGEAASEGAVEATAEAGSESEASNGRGRGRRAAAAA